MDIIRESNQATQQPNGRASYAEENIPEELRRRRQWVAWKYETRDDKATKVPYDPTSGARASTGDSETWGALEDAVAALGRLSYDGVGFVFSSGDPYAGVDLDKCRNPETGELAEWARELVEDLGGYADVSPSGTGVHIIVRGTAPNKRRGRVEAYSSGRYFTVTGEAIRGAGEEIPHKQDVLDALVRKYLDKPQPAPATTVGAGFAGASPQLSDEEVIRLCRSASNSAKFSALYDTGDISAHSGVDRSSSGADQALMNMLAFYTQDVAQLERLFSGSALARRRASAGDFKWHSRPDYQRDTINKALSDLGNTYTGGSASRAKPGARTHRGGAPGGDSVEDPGQNVRALAFQRADVAGALRRGVEPPDVLVEGNLLRGKVHSVYSAGGTGKTFYAAYLTRRVLDEGGKVVYFDQENGLRIMAERAECLGISPEMAERLYFFPFPTMPLDPAVIGAFEDLLDEIEPDLVIFDSWVNHLSMCGLDENSSVDLAAWSDAYSTKCRHREITALILDHVPKDGSGPRGSGRKRDYVDVLWELRNPQPFNRETVGRLNLHLSKDREGWLPSVLTYSVGGGEDGFIFKPSQGTFEQPDEEGLTAKERDTLAALEDLGKSGAFDKEWLEAAKARGVGRSKYYESRKRLRGLGLVEETMGKYFVNGPADDPPDRPSGQPTGLRPGVEGFDVHSVKVLQNGGPVESSGRPVDTAGVVVQSSPPPLGGGLTGPPVDKPEGVMNRPAADNQNVEEKAPGEDCEVAGLFANLPDWLRVTLNTYLNDRCERTLRPLCAAVAAELYGSPLRGPEIRDEVERALIGAAPAARSR